MASQSAMGAGMVAALEREPLAEEAAGTVCPACSEASRKAAIVKYLRYELFGCDACGLQFWEPREMPDARWYEQMYGARAPAAATFHPGHRTSARTIGRQ